MSSLQEIEAAIRSLSPRERQQLVQDLPRLLPEMDGDAAWERIIRDTHPRPALSALLNEAEAEYRQNPAASPETSEAEFDRQA